VLVDILKILGNYIVVQISIILFFLPFYWIYRKRHPQPDKFNFSRQLENFFLSKQANYLVFFWAMGEALVWFVIPEFLLLLIIFMRIRRKRELLVYDVGGTIAGTIIAFFMHISYRTIASLPYIQDKMIDQTHAWYDRMGIWGMIYQPFSGVPYKVFTLTAHSYHFFLIYFIVVGVIVRMSRYLIAFGLFNLIYPGLHKYVYRNYVILFLVATFIFSILLLKIYSEFGPNYRVGFELLKVFSLA
jgi:membrane protein YqaA with SNARE-associated domain